LQRLSDVSRNRSSVVPYIAFPDTDDTPPHRLQLSSVLAVSNYISSYFGYPVAGVCPARQFRSARFPIATVPEVTVTENRDSAPNKADIWATRDILIVNAITGAELPEFMSQHPFW
jgi:hypothetical protein